MSNQEPFHDRLGQEDVLQTVLVNTPPEKEEEEEKEGGTRESKRRHHNGNAREGSKSCQSESPDQAAAVAVGTVETAKEDEVLLDGSVDHVDALPTNLQYSMVDLLCTLISMATYIFDLSMDVIVAVYFYHLAVTHDIYHYWYFGLTVAFILIPSLTMTGFSFRWYLHDLDKQDVPNVPTWSWALRLIALMLQVAPILRYMDSIRYGVLSRLADWKASRAPTEEAREMERRRRREYFVSMVYEDADATLLRLFECFMESAPQLVLQIYILIRDPHAVKLNEKDIVGDASVDPVLKVSILAVSILSSLISLAWSLVVYHRSLRYTWENKKNISFFGSLCQFVWHFASITARVLALSLFASAYPTWIGVVIAAHWSVMTAWVISQQTKACNTRCEELLLSLVLGAVYVFSFFNAKEEPTRYKYMIFYGFCFVENTTLITLWFTSSTRDRSWYHYPGIAAHYLMFFGGILFMMLYYGCFHPTGRRISLARLRTMLRRRRRGEKAPDPRKEGKKEGPPGETTNVLALREVENREEGGGAGESGNSVCQEHQVDGRFSKPMFSNSSPQLEDEDAAEDGAAEVRAVQPQAAAAVAAAALLQHRSIRKTSSAPDTATASALARQQQERRRWMRRPPGGRTLKAMVWGGEKK